MIYDTTATELLDDTGSKDPDGCSHGIVFDESKAASMTAAEVRAAFPRLSGRCDKCGYHGIYYASNIHYYAGDW